MPDCDSCEFKTSHVGDFRKHLSSIAHKERCEANLTCHKCLKGFKSKSGCKTHVKTCNVVLHPKKRTVEPRKVEITVKSTFVSTFENAVHAMNRFYVKIMKHVRRDGKDVMDLSSTFDKNVDEYIEQRNDLEDISETNEQPLLTDYYIYQALKDTFLKYHGNVSTIHLDVNIDGKYCDLVVKHNNELHSLEMIVEMIKSSRSYLSGKIKMSERFDISAFFNAEYDKFYEQLIESATKNDDTYNDVIRKQNDRRRRRSIFRT